MQITKGLRLESSTVLTVAIWTYYILNMMYPTRDESLAGSRIYPQATMALICIYCLITSFFYRNIIIRQQVFKSFGILLIIAFIYVFVNGLDKAYDNFLTFLRQNMAIMFAYVWYIDLFKNPDVAKRNTILIFIMQIGYVFFNLWMDLSIGYVLDEKHAIHDSNTGFLFECCIPMAIIFPVRRLRVYLFLILFTGCVFSGQRSAALAALACLPFSIGYLKKDIKKSDVILLSILLAVSIIPALEIAFNNLITRQQLELESGRSLGSGREIFWALVWNHFWDGDILQILFGHGYGSVQKFLDASYGMAIGSHNGWLDYMYMFGLIGLAIYIRIFKFMYRQNKIINKSRDVDYRNIFLIIVVLFVVKCTTSHGFWDISCMPLAMTIALTLHGHYCFEKKKTLNIQKGDNNKRGL